ncbi:putative Receptor protein kinase [Quillaja saponaria]|uniref:Receptor protein kinase n=1 Tax=Quillaja saponaria TaxID=32244 RepID=A0AAD7KNN3_QUISA|nr:putative Receptor protein kinase [Quillaja saponaria]KAJ7944452.1 putative Receptor protein kinase [Quillaja saponaria]
MQILFLIPLTMKMPFSKKLIFLLFFTLSSTFLSATAVFGVVAPPTVTPPTNLLVPSDAVSLLSFKSKADLDNKLLYALNERFDYCQWQGVKCAQGRVVRFVLQGFGLRGVFAPNTLTRLDQLRVLSLRNNSLFGLIPDLSGLFNLKSLFLDHNYFSGSFPPSLLSLHRLQVLHLSYNNLTGTIPVELVNLDRLTSLRLEFNRFNGTFPPLNQSSLQIFNVSWNNLTGPIPITPALSHFDTSSFSWNPGLCGEVIHKVCDSRSPFFGSSNVTSSSGPLGQSAQSQGVVVVSSPPSKKHRSTRVILGFTIGVLFLIAFVICVFTLFRKQSSKKNPENPTMPASESMNPCPATCVAQCQVEPKKEKKIGEIQRLHKSGNLVLCGREVQLYTLEQLMRASAEMLGRGSIGTTYKAVLDNQLIVAVKRLDAGKTAITSSQVFERNMEMVGHLRHPNLVPVRAYFQAKGERLVVYDYQPNGSLFNLIHGSRSTRAKPLHWTSCLKLAEDVAQGVAYIHQASKLIHGNLKSSNVLLGADFEACVTDYTLALLADTSSSEDPDNAAYKAPEARKSSIRATSKSDVYAFGVLLLELLSGKHPSQHPFLMPTDVQNWVRAMRDDEGAEDNQLGMLTELASICSITSPEQRPSMWQVLKMIQEIKECSGGE